MDLTQDSDNENKRVTKKRKFKETEYDDVSKYYEEPFRAEGEVSVFIFCNIFYQRNKNNQNLIINSGETFADQV